MPKSFNNKMFRIVASVVMMTIICIVVIILLLIITENISFAKKAYGTMDNTKTGILYYNIGDTFIKIQFKDSDTWYNYTEGIYGKEVINKMKELALEGRGLNKYINKIYNLENSPEKAQITPHKVYCGEEAGLEDKYSYPIHTRALARGALSYAHWAPVKKDIQKCVCKWYPDFPTCNKLQ